MKAVIQRVLRASVTIEESLHSKIGNGLLVFLGIHSADTEDDIDWIARKIANLRVFEDGEERMNQSIRQTEGDILLVSQFTLIASTKKGNRPSFNEAAHPSKAKAYCENVAAALAKLIEKPVVTGVFAADMKVDLLNDGPVTVLLDTRHKE